MSSEMKAYLFYSSFSFWAAESLSRRLGVTVVRGDKLKDVICCKGCNE